MSERAYTGVKTDVVYPTALTSLSFDNCLLFVSERAYTGVKTDVVYPTVLTSLSFDTKGKVCRRAIVDPNWCTLWNEASLRTKPDTS